MSPGSTARVVFLNENTLGHVSYLPRFARELERRPELGIEPLLIDVTPLPPPMQRSADWSIRGVRRLGLDFHVARWRRVVSRHAAALLEEARRRGRVDAVLVNTQSVALDLAEVARELPVVVCLDATFAQLSRSRWFAPHAVARWFHPLTLAPIRDRERRVFRQAARLLAWSAPVRDSLRTDYGIDQAGIEVLPPSLNLDEFKPAPRPENARPQVLFLGGDFIRKGGPALLAAFRSRLAARCDLHVVTQTGAPSGPGVTLHRDVKAGSAAWLERWRSADVFVFPSTLETFGIVLVEALAFGVPVVSSSVGAARDILGEGQNGLLLDAPAPDRIADAVEQILRDPAGAQARAALGRARVERDFDLARNTGRLAARLRELVESREARRP